MGLGIYSGSSRSGNQEGVSIRLNSDEDSPYGLDQSNCKMNAITVCKTAFDWSDIANCQSLSAHLFREGFVSINHITDTVDIELIRTELLSLLNDQSGKKHKIRNLGEPAGGTHAGSIFEVTSPSTPRLGLLKGAFFQRALPISRTILGASARPLFDHCYSNRRTTRQQLTGTRMARTDALPVRLAVSIGGCPFRT